MNYLNMVLYNNERFPFNPLMQVKTFSLFQSKFSLWLAKDWVTEGLQRRVKFGKCCSWLISCEIVMSGLMKLTEKFLIYMLVKNKKMFQRAVLVYLQDYPANYKLWSRKDRVEEGQNSMILKSFFFEFKLITITRKKFLPCVSISTFIFYHFYHHRSDTSGIHCLIKGCIFLFKSLWFQYPEWEFKASKLCLIVYHR